MMTENRIEYSSTTLLEPPSRRLGGGERIRVAAGHFMLGGGPLLFAVEKHGEVGLAVPSLRRANRLRSVAGRLVGIDSIGTGATTIVGPGEAGAAGLGERARGSEPGANEVR